jgi:organic hydroperoxide reductase OsmC/OhrA
VAGAPPRDYFSIHSGFWHIGTWVTEGAGAFAVPSRARYHERDGDARMSQYTAIISWERDGADFLANTYSRRHLWSFDGGATVAGSSSPHVVPLPFSDPAAVDPEEAFVASLSSCHMLWFLSLAAKHGFAVERYRDAAEGEMAKNAEGKLAMTVVTLKPQVTFAGRAPTRDELEALHHEAHGRCFIANSVKTEVRCEPVW